MSKQARRSGSWCSTSRWIAFIFIVQIVAVTHFLVSKPLPPTSDAPHHHFVSTSNDHSTRHYFILIGILSDRTSAVRRDAVRDTWLHFYEPGFGNHRMIHKFVIGQPYCVMQRFECDQQTLALEGELEMESQLHRDILRVNVLENYNTLSEKMCALVEWAALQSFDYFLKTDHDIFLRLDTIFTELEAMGPKDNYWSGFAWHDVPPISDRSDKNRELLYELGKFPPYTAGALHILSSNLVRALSSSLPRRYYQNEDQSLGVWLLPFNVTPIHDKRIQQWDVCNSLMIAKHPLSPQRMRDMYDNVVKDEDEMCKSFDNWRCPLCWDCEDSQEHWVNSGLTCDERGASVGASLLANDPPTIEDDVMAGVLGYLPYVPCKRRELEDQQLSYNYVKNGHLDKKTDMGWTMKGGVGVVNAGLYDHAEDIAESCVRLTPSSSESRISFISQSIEIGQKTPEALVFSAWSKAEGVDATSNLEDYALFVNIIYTDNTDFQGFTVHFTPGTHEWEYNVRVFNPDKPIAKIQVYCLFRFHRGTVWFDNISVTKLSDGLCDIKSQSQFFQGFVPDTLSPVRLSLPAPKPTKSGLTFIVIWTTADTTFLLRHRRAIESIFYHHPDAHVRMYSNSLPLHFFQRFNSAGFRIEVVRYDLEALAVGLPGERWVGNIKEWQTGESFYAHVADYLRFVLLFREGGVYTDMDSILVRPIDEANVIGVEHCDEDTLDYCIYLAEFDASERYYLPIGFLVLAPSHPLLFSALSFFDTRYDPNLWPCGTIYLTLAYTQLVLAPRSVADNSGLVRILPREAFYPVPWQEIRDYFSSDDPVVWGKIQTNSYAVHLWGKVSAADQPEPHSLVWRVLNQFSLSNLPYAEGPF